MCVVLGENGDHVTFKDTGPKRGRKPQRHRIKEELSSTQKGGKKNT
jgi:hypothetical protein